MSYCSYSRNRMTSCCKLDVQRPSHWCQLDIDRTCERLVKFLTRESFAIGVTGLGSVGGKRVDIVGVLKWRQFKHVESTWILPRGFHVLKSTWRRVRKFHLNSKSFPRGFHMNSTKIAHWVYILDQTAPFSAILESFHCCIQHIYSFTFTYFAHAP